MIRILLLCLAYVHGKNDFVDGSKILLNTDLKIILLDHQNIFIGILKLMNNAAKSFDIQLVWAFYVIILIVQQNFIFSDLYF